MDRNPSCVFLINPTATWSPKPRSNCRSSVVLPEPISPVRRENAAWDSKPYSSIVSALACWRDKYRNAGSGVSANGLDLKPKWRSYIRHVSLCTAYERFIAKRHNLDDFCHPNAGQRGDGLESARVGPSPEPQSDH